MTSWGPMVAIVYLVAMNVAAFASFGVDKRRAQRGQWRISERGLMALAILGGSIGVLAGMQVFRHKTRKPLFARGVPLVLIAQVVLALAVMRGGLLGQSVQPPEDFEEASIAYVVDGDTIDVMVGGDEQRVRLTGVDAPESASHQEELNTREGEQATEFVRGLLPQGRTVYLQKEVSETDKYDRLLRYVWLELPADPLNPDEVRAKMLNAIIVEAGYAQAKGYEPDTTYEGLFEECQRRAAGAGAGVSYLWE